MKIKKLGMLLVGGLALGPANSAQAMLFDHGNGAIYDSDRDMTWPQAASGQSGWDQAMAWRTDTVFGYLGRGGKEPAFYAWAVRSGGLAVTTPVPEPALLLLTVMGLAGAGILKRQP